MKNQTDDCSEEPITAVMEKTEDDVNRMTVSYNSEEEDEYEGIDLPRDGDCAICGYTKELRTKMTFDGKDVMYICSECKNSVISELCKNTQEWDMIDNQSLPKRIQQYIDKKRGPIQWSLRWWMELLGLVVVVSSLTWFLLINGFLS